ncbi:hypothetical protein AB5I41_13445 [Sphingomonas sp. MMS24-JH45]
MKTPMVTTIHGFGSDRILPMYEPYQDRVHYVRDQRGRPAPGAALRRDDPSRHPGRRLRLRSRGQRGPVVLRQRSSGQGRGACHRGGAGERARAGPLRRGAGPRLSSARSRRSWDPTLRYHGAVGGAARVRWGRRARCCTSSTSTSRSGCEWWRPWRADAGDRMAHRRGSMPELIDVG